MTHVPNNDLAVGYSAGQIDALRRVDWKYLENTVCRDIHALDYAANAWAARIRLAFERKHSNRTIHEAVDGRVANRSVRRKAHEQLAAIRALRKEQAQREAIEAAESAITDEGR
jgi:hypothetical protein